MSELKEFEEATFDCQDEDGEAMTILVKDLLPTPLVETIRK